jgi:alpha-tubulin suppressor-like RCC1 family protein
MNRIALSNKKLLIATLLFGMSSTACGPDADLDKGFSCTTQADCAAGFLCFSSICEKIVASASECAAGKVFAPQANVCAKPTCENGLQQSACAPDSPLLKTIDFYCRIGQDCAAQFTCFAERCEAQASAQLDCRPGKAFVESLSLCVTPSCSNGVQDAFEGGVDCGSGCALACPVTESCSDNLQNQGETGVDCGGPCGACATCADGITNGGEEGVDCGGPCVRSCSGCGNGTVDVGEACDHGGTPSAPCEYGRTSCTTCGPMCQFEAGTPEFCGDGSVQTAAGEECDHSGAPQVSCPQGTQSCMVCNAQCKLVPGAVGPVCGDGIVQMTRGEECDRVESSLDCLYGESSCERCTSDCKIISGNVVGSCGDGLIQSAFGETCDSGFFGGLTCADFGHVYGAITCADNCTRNDASTCYSFGQVSSGTSHTCAVMTDGTARCWGANVYGELGNGASGFSVLNPSVVSNLMGAKSISAGSGHTCAALTDGTVRCWGQNNSGQLGSGSNVNHKIPFAVVGLNNVQIVSAGESHTCAVLNSGTVRCWGNGANGRLGDGTSISKNNPTLPLGLGGSVSDISVGLSHSCALLVGGTVKCWGRNNNGQLGDGTAIDRNTPVDVIGLSNVQSLSAGYDYTCAVLSGGSVQCWGANAQGQLGRGARTMFSSVPMMVVGLMGVRSVSTGDYNTCAVLGDDTAQCWGRNSYGEIGDGTNESRLTPVKVIGLNGINNISAGSGHTCAVLHDGTARCWGVGNNGRLGQGSTTNSSIPVSPVL